MGTSFCSPLKPADREAFQLCRILERSAVPFRQIDRGVSRIHFSNPLQPLRRHESGSDGILQPREVYDYFIHQTEQEERQDFLSLGNPGASRRPPSRFLSLLSQTGKIRLPWIFDDLNPRSREDAELLNLAWREIKSLQNKLRVDGVTRDGPEYRRRLATDLFAFLRRPREQGGLGIRYWDKPPFPARLVGQLFKDGNANCLEFSYLFYALGRLAGIPVFPVEVFRNSAGGVLFHTRAGVRYDPRDSSKVLFLDIADGFAGEKKGEVWAELSRLDLLAYFYLERGILAGQSAAAEFWYRKALRFAPDQYAVLYNYGWWALHSGKNRFSQASQLLESSWRSNPYFPNTYLALEKVYRTQGYDSQARWAQKRAQDLFKGQEK